MIRPLLTALIEYVLAYIVFKNGKVHKNLFSVILFLLATYQLGELVIFLTHGQEIGFKIAYTATTLLPAFGLLLVQKITKKQLGYWLFQIVAVGLIMYLLMIPAIATKFELGPFCVRIFQYEDIMGKYWPYFYQGTLLYSILAMVWGIWKAKSIKTKAVLQQLLIGYITFDAFTFVIIYFIPWLQYSSASLMCALALIASLIFTKISLAENLNILYKKTMKNGIL